MFSKIPRKTDLWKPRINMLWKYGRDQDSTNYRIERSLKYLPRVKNLRYESIMLIWNCNILVVSQIINAVRYFVRSPTINQNQGSANVQQNFKSLLSLDWVIFEPLSKRDHARGEGDVYLLLTLSARQFHLFLGLKIFFQNWPKKYGNLVDKQVINRSHLFLN